MNASAASIYGEEFLNAVNAGQYEPGGVYEAMARASAGGAGSNVNVSPAPVNVAVINNKAQLREFLRSNEGRQIMVDEMTAQKMEIGLQS